MAISLTRISLKKLLQTSRNISSEAKIPKDLNLIKNSQLELLGSKYEVDSYTNITSRVTGKLGKQLHNKKGHPINLMRHCIQNFFNSNFLKPSGNPLFVVFDNLNPVVTCHQNFDSLLFPSNHPGRSPKDSYFANSKYLLRSHITAHDEELIKMGFDAFLSVGDVYRRDEIDSTHYPVFHQMDGVRLFTEEELLHKFKDFSDMKMFEKGCRTNDRQEEHTVDAAKLIEIDLKSVLVGVTQKLFGKDVKYRWSDTYFPFTHPSWELEILFNDDWLEVLGCGVIEQKILNNAGVTTKAGWAFGVGLDRLSMIDYHIPDIRLLWSEDRRFLDQFDVDNPETKIVYKPVSRYLSRQTDISFWIPESYSSNDFYDIVRSIGGDIIEKVSLIDVYSNAKSGRTSHCYSIFYQHMERALTLEEVKQVHNDIAEMAIQQLGVTIR